MFDQTFVMRQEWGCGCVETWPLFRPLPEGEMDARNPANCIQGVGQGACMQCNGELRCPHRLPEIPYPQRSLQEAAEANPVVRKKYRRMEHRRRVLSEFEPNA
jgi:hypothetical protein